VAIESTVVRGNLSVASRRDLKGTGTVASDSGRWVRTGKEL